MRNGTASHGPSHHDFRERGPAADVDEAFLGRVVSVLLVLAAILLIIACTAAYHPLGQFQI